MESASNSKEFVPPRVGKIQKCNHLEDRISYLPEKVLISVLSRLDIKQAARTSILACRWTELWRYAMSLRFVSPDGDASELLEDEYTFYDARCREFVDRVNHILESLLDTSIEDFTVIFGRYGKSCQRDVDGWLKFALQKKVKRLKFKLSCGWRDLSTYSLTNEVIRNHKVDSLTSVYLLHLDVAGDFLEYLLSASPFLEELSVSDSQALVNFTVTGQSLKLKYLEITGCLKLEHLYIYGVNLVSFKYFGFSKCVAINDTLYLAKAHITLVLVDTDRDNDVQILSHLPLLETLILQTSIVQNNSCLPKFPTLRYLKNLELVFSDTNICHLLCAHLLKTSLLLNELKVEFQFFRETSDEKAIQRLEHQHSGLKVAKFSGFIGCRLDLAIVLYVIENAAALEKVIVDTSHPYRRKAIDPNKQDTARTIARAQLSEKILVGELIVI